MNRNEQVSAIIVTYCPQWDVVKRLVILLQPQVDALVIVDNCSHTDPHAQLGPIAALDSKLSLIRLSENLGIATAQNIGIEHAKKQGARYVILFDQDSEPAPDMVARLLEAKSAAEHRGYRVGAVGPNYVDERQQNPPPFIRIEGIKLVRVNVPEAETGLARVDYLISSGSLIPIDVLEVVGPMREELFIDYVDIEWGLRARRAGFLLFGAFDARMCHRLGDAPLKWRGRHIPSHSPLRHYYHFRNAIWLYRQSWVPLNWKLVDGFRLLLKFGFYALYAKPRIQQARMMMLGMYHGMSDRMRRYPG